MKKSSLIVLTLASLALCSCKSDGGNTSDSKENDEVISEIPADGFLYHLTQPASPVRVPMTLAGANYLATRDLLEGTFGDRVKSLNTTLLRWPGGALTETWEPFLDTYINGAHTRDWGNISHNEPWALSNFLDWSSKNQITPTIVLPFRKYIDEHHNIDFSTMEQELGAFVEQVTTGRFGQHPVTVWEIGNEFMWGSDEEIVSEETYGDLASRLVEVLHDRAAYPIKVGIQAGRLGNNRISRVASRFTAAQKSKVDFLIDHIYTRNFDYDTFDGRFPLYRNNWGMKPIYISEWNVKSSSDADLSYYAFGIEQAAPMLRVWDAMVTNNVEWAAFWAVQQNNYTSAYPLEGVSPGAPPYIGGIMLQWLTKTIGMERLDVTELGTEGIFIRAYASDTEIIVLAAGLEVGNQQVKIRIPGFEIQTVEAEKMSGEKDQARYFPDIDSISPKVNENLINFTINSSSPQELVKLEIRGHWR